LAEEGFIPSLGKKLRKREKKAPPFVASMASFKVSMKRLRIGRECKREVDGACPRTFGNDMDLIRRKKRRNGTKLKRDDFQKRLVIG
jgi:hypothetical protein